MALDFQVVVAGGGPVGSFVAARLAGLGVKTLVIDRKTGESTPICTGIIGVEMERLVPVPRAAVLSEVKRVRLNVAKQRELLYSNHGTIAYVIDRKRFDGYMLERAARAGAEYERPVTLVSMEFHGPDRVRLEVESGGSKRKITTNLLVLATGFSPKLLNMAGLEGYPSTTEGAQVEVDAPMENGTIEVLFSHSLVPKGFLWVVPAGDKGARIGLVTPQNSVKILKKVLESDALEERVGRLITKGIRMRLLPRAPIPKSYGNGLMVVGEAAGQLKATTYGGIYYGLLCGECAVDTAITALELRDSSDNVLSSYEVRWRARIGEELSQGARWRDLFESMSDQQMVAAADIIGAEGVFNKIKNAVKFDWHRDIIGLGLAHLKKRGIEVLSNSVLGGEQ